MVIGALPALRRHYPSISLDIVGDGPALPDLRRLAERLEIGHIVRFHGQQRQRETLHLLKQADLFCLPTVSEGFPKAVLEAMACGLPVVTTPVSILPHLVGDEAGRMLKDISPDAVTDAVRDCLADPGRYAELSRTARQRAEQLTLDEWVRTIGGHLAEAGVPVRSIEHPIS